MACLLLYAIPSIDLCFAAFRIILHFARGPSLPDLWSANPQLYGNVHVYFIQTVRCQQQSALLQCWSCQRAEIRESPRVLCQTRQCWCLQSQNRAGKGARGKGKGSMCECLQSMYSDAIITTAHQLNDFLRRLMRFGKSVNILLNLYRCRAWSRGHVDLLHHGLVRQLVRTPRNEGDYQMWWNPPGPSLVLTCLSIVELISRRCCCRRRSTGLAFLFQTHFIYLCTRRAIQSQSL